MSVDSILSQPSTKIEISPEDWLVSGLRVVRYYIEDPDTGKDGIYKSIIGIVLNHFS